MAAPDGLADEQFPPGSNPSLAGNTDSESGLNASAGDVVSSVQLPPVVTIADLITAHHAMIFRYAYRLSGNSTDAEDLTQQTFMVAQQKLHQLREADRAGAWLYAVLRS